ncbi:MAG: hypothetical protein ACI8S6_002514 [Myxococcota bacterium]|jgi:hypothetical protein
MNSDQQEKLKALFESAQEDLLRSQGELSKLISDTAADPWLETQQQPERDQLTSQRDEQLQKWSRLALSWMLRGGKFEMIDGQGNTSEISAPRPVERISPTIVRRAPVRSAPVVQTIRRGRAEPNYTTQPTQPAAATWQRPTPTINELDGEALRDLLDALEEPAILNTLEDVRGELERLLQSSTSQILLDWTAFPKSVQRSLVGHVVARARHIQDELNPDIFPPDLSHDLDRIFSGMTAFSKREQPGFVFGLMRHHHPVGENWLSDSQKWWQDLINQLPEDIRPDPEGALEELEQLIEEEADEAEIIDQTLTALEDGLSSEDPRLVKLMAPHKALLGKHTQFKKLRKAIRDLDSSEE